VYFWKWGQEDILQIAANISKFSALEKMA